MYKLKFIKTLFLPVVLVSCLFVSNCNNSTSPTASGNVQGNWRMTFLQGYLQDVCFGETVSFPSNTSGTATLTCPYSTSIQANYTVDNNVLTYTDTGLQYTITSSTSNLLVLTGVNVGRIITYESISASDKSVNHSQDQNGTSHSSEHPVKNN